MENFEENKIEEYVDKKPTRLENEEGIVIPIILWWMGVPLVLVLLLWFFVF